MRYSIIIPAFNVEDYIGRCIQSVLEQTINDYELIIVDDGSTDGTLNVLNRIKATDNRIKVIEKDHTNAGDARNMALEMAVGEWLVFIDADDIVNCNLLKKAEEIIEKESCDLISFRACAFDEVSGIKIALDWVFKDDIVPDDNPFEVRNHKKSIFQMFSTNIWNKIVKRELVVNENIKFSSLDDANDELFGSMILACSKRIAYINESLYFYRVNTGKSTQDNAKKNTSLCFIEALRQIRVLLNNKDLYSTYESSYLDKVIVESVNALLREKEWERFKYVYDAIQKLINKELKIPKTYYISDEHYRTWFSYIANKTAEELMFYFYTQKDWEEINMKDWAIPYDRIKGKRLILFGAGNIGQSFYKQLQRCKDVNVVKWVDSDSEKYKKIGLEVNDIDEISDTVFDLLLVAIKDGKNNVDLKRKINELVKGKEIIFI